MEALAEGQLSLVAGCLRIVVPGEQAPGFLILWPPATTIRVAGAGVVEVLDASQQVVARVGETIRLGGGAMENPEVMKFWEAQITGLPLESCPGPYWVAGALVPLPAVEPIAPRLALVHLGMPWADFSLRFDPAQWEITLFRDEMPDLQSLAHRSLAGGCRITPNIPVDLGEDWTVADGQVTLTQRVLDSRHFYQNGVLKFVGYYSFLGPNREGAVEVHFEENAAACLQAAESLFATTEVVPSRRPVIHGSPGDAYETLFQIPVGASGIRYRGLSVPNALAVLPDGSFLIADPTDNRLLRYSTAGDLLSAIDLYSLDIVNVSDLVTTPAEIYLLEISYNVAPVRYRVSRLSFDGELIAQYDIPQGYHFDEGLYGLAPAGSNGEILLEFYGEAMRYYQLADPQADPQSSYSGDIEYIPAYGRKYRAIFGSFAEPHTPPAILVDDLRIASQVTLGGLVKVLGVNPDGTFYVIREDLVSDYPVLQGDITIHFLSAEGDQLGAARYPIAEWVSFVQRQAAIAPDGEVYALLPRPGRVDILRLNFYPDLEPLIPSAVVPYVGRARE